eukprot:gene30095-37577_t
MSRVAQGGCNLMVVRVVRAGAGLETPLMQCQSEDNILVAPGGSSYSLGSAPRGASSLARGLHTMRSRTSREQAASELDGLTPVNPRHVCPKSTNKDFWVGA